MGDSWRKTKIAFVAIQATSMKAPADGAADVFLPRRESLPGLVGNSQTFEPPAPKRIQAVATIATAACCSPQNAGNMD